MVRRAYRHLSTWAASVKPALGLALKATFRQGYGRADLQHDLLAGLVVSLVATPLSMALAIATGVAPQHGLYTAIIAGSVVALLGGSRFQITGPTAAFVVILVPIVERFGLQGLLLAGLMSGVILLIMGLAGLGRIIEFIPHPVTTGFTSGIAVVIASMQAKDFLGLKLAKIPDHFIERLQEILLALPTINFVETAVAASALLILVLWPRFNKKIPAPIVSLVVVTLLAYLLSNIFVGLKIETIATRFHTIPQSPPTLHVPWSAAFNFAMFRDLLPSAFVIAILGAIESLLSNVVADGMTRTRHNPDAELIALGIGNILCPFFGGIPATGAIARTATNIRAGARSPLASVFHALFILLTILALAPLISQMPMAGLSAMLLLVAYRMAEVRNFVHILQVGPKSDCLVLLGCFGLTVIFDMVIGVSVGIVLAALLFMTRMAELTSGKAISGKELKLADIEDIPHNIVFYEIAGPLFFGAASKVVEALNSISDEVRIVIFDFHKVPVMDVTGLIALESAIQELTATRRYAIFTGVTPPVKKLIQRSQLISQSTNVALFDHLSEAISRAKELISRLT